MRLSALQPAEGGDKKKRAKKKELKEPDTPESRDRRVSKKVSKLNVAEEASGGRKPVRKESASVSLLST